MEPLYALTASILFGIGIYLMLSKHVVKMIFGIIIVSNAVNLSIFTVGRVSGTNPPFILDQISTPTAFSNALPQALILTAIVIGFGLVAFSLGLVVRAHRDLDNMNNEDLKHVESTNQQAPRLHDGSIIEDAS